ncbi:bis(5'-nucleosyl)-tetraphosphatase (symmetrical) YqeK [Bacillaceae bacterium]
MHRDQWLALVRKELPEQRYQHTLGVVETAVRLAEKYGADVEKAELAAILHDYAKYWPGEKMREIMLQDERAKEVLNYGKPLWHAHAGAIAAERELGITDPAVLDAIRYHTSGRVGMTLLEKIVWLADYIEPGRQFPGVEKVREIAEDDLDAAIVTAFAQTIAYLAERKQPIYPVTVEAYNDLLQACEAKRQEEGERRS